MSSESPVYCALTSIHVQCLRGRLSPGLINKHERGNCGDIVVISIFSSLQAVAVQ